MTPPARFPLYAQILVAMVLGAFVGAVAPFHTGTLGELGKLVIQLIKTFAVPLLFLAIVDAFLKTRVEARAAGKLLAISAINATFALAIGLGLSNLLQPGRHLAQPAEWVAASTSPATTNVATGAALAPSIDPLKTFAGYLPSNLVDPFAQNSVVTVILMAVLLGLALRRTKDEGDHETSSVENGVAVLLRANSLVLGWIIRLIPFAVFGVVAQTVGEQGFAPARGLAIYLGVALLGLLLQIVFVYQAWLILVARMSLTRFWSGTRDAIFYALGASSSLATLPVTLKGLEKMGVSGASARLSACVGTNLNNDGILLYEAMAVLFVAQAHGIDLTLGQQVLAAAACIVASIGIAGIPDAGLISLSLVLSTVGLPLELLPLLLTVDWILSRARATTNVIADFLGAVLLDRTRAGS